MSVKAFETADPGITDFFAEHGWVIVNTLSALQVSQISGWVDGLIELPITSGVLHYRELTDAGPVLCRTENFIPAHSELRDLLTSGVLLNTASALLAEPAVLYKEKVNYKRAGGAGFSPHQDAPAYPFLERHISCMVAIDNSDTDNGCLEVVDRCHRALIPTNDVGCIPDHIADAHQWLSVPLAAGQVLWFHSWTPHRSAENRSSRDRRALYPTYNAASEGDLRSKYYEEKITKMSQQRVGSNVQVSLIGDFLGRPVPEDLATT